MAPAQLSALLENLTGHLTTTTEAEEISLQNLQQQLAGSLLQQDIAQVSNKQFSFNDSDLYFRQNIKDSRLSKLDEIVSQTVQNQEISGLRVFVRDVPVRTTQVAGSVPSWAAGATPVETAGPFINREGRWFWFDFYRVEKLIALYIQGQTNPAILFKATFKENIIQVITHAHIEITTNYTLVPGSVWINAHMLSPAAPVDRYVGVKVKGGSIKLDVTPTLQNNLLTVAVNNNIHVSLALEQRADSGAASNSAYGIDARHASYNFPESFEFTMNGSGKNIIAIAGASCKIYGQAIDFTWAGNQSVEYNPLLSKIAIPWKYSPDLFEVSSCESPFCTISGKAKIINSWWTLPAAVLDINNPLEADSNGGVIIQCDKGLYASWTNLQNEEAILVQPFIIGEPGRIGITDLASSSLGASQHFDLWLDKQNLHGTSADLLFLPAAPFIFNTISQGDEMLLTLCNVTMNIDRPVKVNGEPFDVRSKNSLLMLAVSTSYRLIYLYDDNILWDNKTPLEQIPSLKPVAIALENALFTVSQVNGCLLFGQCNEEWKKVTEGSLFLTFGLISYLPILPDPYTANLNVLLSQFERGHDVASGNRRILLWLICVVQYKPLDDIQDDVKVSFHFGNIVTQSANATISSQQAAHIFATANVAADVQSPFTAIFQGQPATNSNENLQFETAMAAAAIPNYDQEWNNRFGSLSNDAFALLDVSSNANQLGISFGTFGGDRMAMIHTADAVTTTTDAASNNFPFQVQEMSVVARGVNVRAFMLPLVAWEPVFNLSYFPFPMDPPVLWNYYPNDGGPTKIFNNSPSYVPLAPIPLVDFLVKDFTNNPKNKTAAIFTLPFGLKALAALSGDGNETIKPKLDNIDPKFKNDMVGGIQIMAWAGNYDIKAAVTDPAEKDSRMFPGYIIQLNNILDMAGNPTPASTLGDSVTRIFNGEFFTTPTTSGTPPGGRGVPVTRIDFTGYGANMFSNWLSPSAQFGLTSQARFDVMLGRTAHEVIQVKSILYPWGIKVVRTITLFRASNNYVFRVDSGWKAESDGKFDFRYKYVKFGTTIPIEEIPYQIHPGIIKGLFNVQNIQEDPGIKDFVRTNVIPINGIYLSGLTGEEIKNTTGSPINEQIMCRPVWFDCDVEIENVVQGHTNGRIPSKKVLGYVQLAPNGKPLTEAQFQDLMNEQGGSIGGPVSCTVDINKSKQQVRINRFDVNISTDKIANIAFAAAARGNVFLPKEGSWSLVQHNVGTGEVTPLAEAVTVPLVRIGEWVKNTVVTQADIDKQLVKIAHPMELLRDAVADTNNFGFLQSTATQKALFLTPSYAKATEMLLSKTPPLFADAYRLMTGKGIFPNIGNAIDNFGKVMPLLNVDGVQAFTERLLPDGSKVLELLKVEAEKKGEEVIKQGMNLLQKGADGILNKALKFDVPSFDIPLIEMDGLKIYIDYKTGKDKEPPGSFVDSKLNFDVNSFAGAMADQWKGRLNNLSMVVDLGDIKRLMIIKGNFETRKGKEAGYEGDSSALGGLPVPEIEFNEKLQPLIDLLQMLADLSTGNYAATLKRGMKIAMSNSGEIWEYKFEASKDIPLLRFPPTDLLYNDPNCPLKLEAAMSIGVYFNAALKVTTDPKQLLPTAGAYLQFKGGLSVMCFSISIGTIYAVGAVGVKIACDTKIGPSVTLKFGFGAQIVVGLPVVGNVSVLYMIGVEMYAGVDRISLTGFMLFRGQADLLGGLVCVTITIEAKGTVERIGDETNCSASVTFAIDISIFLIIDISFSKTWGEQRQIA